MRQMKTHRKTLMNKAGLEEDSKNAAWPLVKVSDEMKDGDEKELERMERTEFRGNCAC